MRSFPLFPPFPSSPITQHIMRVVDLLSPLWCPCRYSFCRTVHPTWSVQSLSQTIKFITKLEHRVQVILVTGYILISFHDAIRPPFNGGP